MENGHSGAGTRLSIDGLTKAEVRFLEQTDSPGTPLGLNPAVLLAPPCLGVTAMALMTSLELRENFGAGGKYPVANPHAGKFQVVRSAKGQLGQALNDAMLAIERANAHRQNNFDGILTGIQRALVEMLRIRVLPQRLP